jgi:hypothetical protein
MISGVVVYIVVLEFEISGEFFSNRTLPAAWGTTQNISPGKQVLYVVHCHIRCLFGFINLNIYWIPYFIFSAPIEQTARATAISNSA